MLSNMCCAECHFFCLVPKGFLRKHKRNDKSPVVRDAALSLFYCCGKKVKTHEKYGLGEIKKTHACACNNFRPPAVHLVLHPYFS